MDVLFQARTWARSRGGPDKGPTFLVFDVVLEENVLGIPVSALPLVGAAVVVVAVSRFFFLVTVVLPLMVSRRLQMCVAIVPWWARTAAPAAIEWIQSGGARRSQRRPRARGGAK